MKVSRKITDIITAFEKIFIEILKNYLKVAIKNVRD